MSPKGRDQRYHKMDTKSSKQLSEKRRAAALSRWSNGVRPEGPLLVMRCPEEEAAALRTYARRERIAPSEALRRAIRHYLATH